MKKAYKVKRFLYCNGRLYENYFLEEKLSQALKAA